MSRSGPAARRDQLFHRVEGKGPPVLLLNGVSMTLAGWEPVARALRAHHRVIRCDLRGQLRTPGPPPPRMEDHLADVSSLLAALGVERTHVVGTSFGAALALVLAARHPERIGAVVAATVGPGGRPALLEVVEGWRRACERVLGDGDRAAFQRALEGDLFGRTTAREHPERLEALRRQVLRLPRRWFEDLRALLDTAGTTGLDASLPGVEAPVLVVAAGEDRLVPPDDAAWLAQRLPRGRLEVVPRSGHALVLERPDELARLAADFLGRHPLPD